MTIRSLALAAALSFGVLSGTASADDTLRGTAHAASPVSRHTSGSGTYRAGTHRSGAYRGHGHTRHAYRPHVRRVPVQRVHAHRHGHCDYVEGHHVVRRVRVVLPGHHVERVIPARYEVRWRGFGHGYVQVLVQARHVVREWVPERVVYRNRRVWVRGRWVCS